MPNYRRIRVPGGMYFFTVRLAEPGSTLLIDQIDALRAAYTETIAAYPVVCNAMVVLPDHLHAIWTLPPGDSNYSERWRLLKYRFTHAVKIRKPRSLSQRRKREAGIWQRRFWEHLIRGPADLQLHMHYCWADPVRHGLAGSPVDWPYSSIHRDLRAGKAPRNWQARVIQGGMALQ